jgi:hypothetical protein
MDHDPVSEGNFYYGRHGFQVDVGGFRRESRATALEIQLTPWDSRHFYWWQALCAQYDLSWPANRLQAYGHFTRRYKAGLVTVAQRIQEIKGENFERNGIAARLRQGEDRRQTQINLQL